MATENGDTQGFRQEPPAGSADTWTSASDRVTDMTSGVAQNAASLNAKVIDHAEENVREAFRALRAAVGSSSVQDVVKAQSEYVKDQSARSMAQAREIGEMIAQFGRSAVDAWKPKA